MMKQHSRKFYRLNIVLTFILISVSFFAIFLTENQPEQAISFQQSEAQDSLPATSGTLQTASGLEMRIAEYALAHGLSYNDYPQSLIALLERNPETETFVLEYPLAKDAEYEIDLSEYSSDQVPLFMQWDQRWGYIQYGSDLAGLTACGPVCLSMVTYYLTGNPEMTPAYMIGFAQENGYCIPGDGTSWTLFSEGALQLGLDVTEIPLVEERIIDNLKVDNPIICAVGPGDFTETGHYIVMVAYKDGLIRVNDPNSYANSQKLWDYETLARQIKNLWVIRYIE